MKRATKEPVPQGARTRRKVFFGEFDPGSGRTLAACLTHASRTGLGGNSRFSGGRVRNTWGTYPATGGSRATGRVIPRTSPESHGSGGKAAARSRRRRG